MKMRAFAALLVFMWSAGGHVQTFDTAKLDLLFDRLLEENKRWEG
jgi:hypothetical protein